MVPCPRKPLPPILLTPYRLPSLASKGAPEGKAGDTPSPAKECSTENLPCGEMRKIEPNAVSIFAARQLTGPAIDRSDVVPYRLPSALRASGFGHACPPWNE